MTGLRGNSKASMMAAMAGAAIGMLAGANVKDLRVDVPAPRENANKQRRYAYYKARGHMYPHSSIKEDTRTGLQYEMVKQRNGFTTMQKRKGTAAANLLTSDLGKDFRNE